MNQAQSQVVIYQTEDGRTKLEVRLENETLWLPQAAIAELFQTTIPNVTTHIKSIYDDGELTEARTIKENLIVQNEGDRSVRRAVRFYDLDMIISIGYRVKSTIATQFRIWATQRLREYIVKGFALDDERMKQGGERARYFQELLQRVRDIRSSERNFYQKVTDIYATSVDYRSDDSLTKQFFATVQNKMHFAVHGHTAAEIIVQRADSSKPMMGLTSFKGNYLTAHDTKIAKNYLTEPELNQLNLIVSLFLDFAELQATNERAMRMVDWVQKLDQFLQLSEKKLLHNAGTITSDEAAETAAVEFEKYREQREVSYVSDFDKMVETVAKTARRGGPSKKPLGESA